MRKRTAKIKVLYADLGDYDIINTKVTIRRLNILTISKF